MPNYPSFKMKGHPTPNDKLMICDKCGKAEWTFHTGKQVYCHKSCGRMREATPKEYEEGKAAITTIV